MPWFKVDDSFATSPKVMSIPRKHRMQCLGLWVTAGTWSARHLTDGRIPDHMLEEWGAEMSHGTLLVEAGLWDRGDGSYLFHDWDDYQPTRVDTLANRERERRRKEEWRKNRANKGQSPSGTESREANASQHPDPNPTRTRPDHIKDSSNEESKPRSTRGTRVPSDFVITDAMREWAARETPHVDVDKKLGEWIDYWVGVPGKPGIKSDWVSTWRNGMRKQEEFALRDLARGNVTPIQPKRHQFGAQQ